MVADVNEYGVCFDCFGIVICSGFDGNFQCIWIRVVDIGDFGVKFEFYVLFFECVLSGFGQFVIYFRKDMVEIFDYGDFSVQMLLD